MDEFRVAPGEGMGIGVTIESSKVIISHISKQQGSIVSSHTSVE